MNHECISVLKSTGYGQNEMYYQYIRFTEKMMLYVNDKCKDSSNITLKSAVHKLLP